jgi:hypothetical protein
MAPSPPASIHVKGRRKGSGLLQTIQTDLHASACVHPWKVRGVSLGHLLGDIWMRKAKLLFVFPILALSASPVLAAGCVKGAAVGGVAGHVAGGHGVAGAAAGCVVGHHEASKDVKQQQQADQTPHKQSSQTDHTDQTGR